MNLLVTKSESFKHNLMGQLDLSPGISEDKYEIEIMGFTCLEDIIVHQGRTYQRVLNNVFVYDITVVAH